MCIDHFTGALTARTEQLFYHAGLDAYFVTGQRGAGGRNAYIEMKSAHTLTPAQQETLQAQAQPFDDKSGMTIEVDRVRQRVVMYDQFTKTNSTALVSDLAPPVQERYVQERYPQEKVGYFARLGM